MTIPNRDLLQAARELESAALLTTIAVEHLRGQAEDLDGWPRSTLGDGTSASSDDTTVVERQALAACEFSATREDIRDAATTITVMVRDYVRMLAGIRGVRFPRTVAPTLCDGREFEGAALLWTPGSTDPSNGWHDPLCRDIADSSKLCHRCRVREGRWRRARGLAPRLANQAEPVLA